MLMMEIERKFLVNEIPGGIKIGTGTPILQGYISIEDNSEVRVRQLGKNHFLTSKNGSGLQREETEVPINPEQFDILWPVSKGRRVEKERHIVKLQDGCRAELDIYQGALTGLCLVEVEFVNVDEASQFELPAWFGPEVTGDAQFANRKLALLNRDNLPDDLRNILGETRHSVGAIPVMELNGKDHIIVITTRNNLRWIFPKGNPKAKIADQKVAAQEALEEAGITGGFFGSPIPVHYWKGYVHYIIEYYPMLVSTLHTDWVEKEERQRRVCTFDEAAQLLNDAGFFLAMQRSIKELHTP
jgi:adenylate cyclase